MAALQSPEVWLRGPLPDINPLLQPVAHALLQAREEVTELMLDFPEEKLWIQPAGVASPGFHLQHLTGVLDRLFTYARGETLTEQQLHALRQEGKAPQNNSNVQTLLQQFSQQVDQSLVYLRSLPDAELTKPRGVGRAGLPSTVIGLLVHAAEHTMRHTGQLLVTVRFLQSGLYQPAAEDY